MKNKITMIILFLGLTTAAQNEFEKGYFITKNGEKIECFIKEKNLNFNTSKFTYKEKKTNKSKTIDKNQIEEISIPNKILYKRYIVGIDKYSKDLNKLSKNRIYNLKKENLLLKVIVTGKAKLLKYTYNNVNHFFYEINNVIKPLEFKLFRGKEDFVGKNLNYKKTLKEELNCNNIELNSNIKYKESSLIKYFIKYNSCNNSPSITYSLTKKGKLNLKAKVGTGFINFINNNNKISYNLGVEFEFILPGEKPKLSLFTELFYQTYSTTVDKLILGYNVDVVPSSGKEIFTPIYSSSGVMFNSKSLEIPLGVRYYSILNNKNKLFYNLGLSITLNSNYLIKYNDINQTPITKDFSNRRVLYYYIGLGYEFNEKYNIELRYKDQGNTRDYLTNLSTYNIKPNTFLIKLGYNFL